MDAKLLEQLKTSIDRKIILHCTDGEVITALILSVSEREQDIIYDLVFSNRLDSYRLSGQESAYLIPFSEVECVEERRDDARPMPEGT